MPKTGENIGLWLEDSHGRYGCKPEPIGAHSVDGAANAKASVNRIQGK